MYPSEMSNAYYSDEIYASPIMIVDDNEINRIFLAKTLHARGFKTLLAVASGEEALLQMPHFNPEIVLLDILMPGMDGYECCARIREQEQYRDLPVLVQTTLTDPKLRVKAFRAGATDFVSKPIYHEELCARVLVHLEKRHSLKTLQVYKNRVRIELDSARQLQHAILPSRSDITHIEQDCGLDMASYFRPSSEIGGDFWGMKNLFPHQTALWLVDFSGHGVAAALNAFRLQAYLNEHSHYAARPGEYLSHMNDKLLQLLLRGQFATMFYGIIDTQSSRLFYACACSPHPIIIRRGGKPELLDGSGTPLGIGMQLYPTNTTHFAPGDTLLLYSDALTETHNAAGEFISEEDIMALLSAHPGLKADEIKALLVDHFNAHTGGALRDDLTIAVCVRSGA